MEKIVTAAEIKAQLAEAEVVDNEVVSGSEYIQRRLKALESEVSLANQAIAGLSEVESKNNNENIKMFLMVGCALVLTSLVLNRDGKSITSMRTRILDLQGRIESLENPA
jgi:hypothetical protein